MARRRRGSGQTALITGASGGIGEALAKRFAADGHDLVLVARSEAKLDLLAGDLATGHGVRVMTVPFDLGEANAGARLQAEVTRDGRHVDVLVNNAGFGLLGRFVALDHNEQLAMIDLNVRALTDLARAFLPAMVGHGRGGVLNVASMAAFQPGPGMAVYYATKAYVLSFSQALNAELKGTGVHVTAVCPGPAATGFQERGGMGDINMLKFLPVTTADRAAASAYAAFRARRAVAVPGVLNKALAVASALTPRFLALPLVRFMHGGGE